MPSEPRTLTHLDNPARTFMVSNESDIIFTAAVEYRGGGWWCGYADTTDDPDVYNSRSIADAQRWAATTMEEQADKARATCGCGTDGEDTTGNGNFACGVLSPHGISVTVTDADGNDLTQDYYINGM
jgi:hypothetical protein